MTEVHFVDNKPSIGIGVAKYNRAFLTVYDQLCLHTRSSLDWGTAAAQAKRPIHLDRPAVEDSEEGAQLIRCWNRTHLRTWSWTRCAE